MYRFALRPRWLLSHLLVAAMVVGMVNLGLWQLRRLDERRDRNDVIAARVDQDPVPVATVLDAVHDVDEARYRPVQQRGRYLSGSLLVDNRSLDGLPGVWVLSPLRLEDGSTVMVNRGFLGTVAGQQAVPPTPIGAVSVTGTLVPWVTRGCGTRTDASGAIVGAACMALPAAESAASTELLPVVIQRSASVPADTDELSVVPLPELGEGSHLAYAVQWFIFTLIALVGYPLILRRNARDRARPEQTDAPVVPPG